MLNPTTPGGKMAAEKVATKPFILMPQGLKALSWSQDFFRTSDISKQACLHSTQLPGQIGKKTKVFPHPMIRRLPWRDYSDTSGMFSLQVARKLREGAWEEAGA